MPEKPRYYINCNYSAHWCDIKSVIFVLFCSLMEEVVHTSPTLGSNVEEVVWKNIHFIMWDIGGQESLRQSWATYYANTEVSFATNQMKITRM